MHSNQDNSLTVTTGHDTDPAPVVSIYHDRVGETRAWAIGTVSCLRSFRDPVPARLAWMLDAAATLHLRCFVSAHRSQPFAYVLHLYVALGQNMVVYKHPPLFETVPSDVDIDHSSTVRGDASSKPFRQSSRAILAKACTEDK